MHITLKAAGQLLMDKFYQDYAPRDAFFAVEDFMRDLALQYSALLNEQFQMQRRETKVMDGFSNVEIPPGWLINVEAEIKFDEAREQSYVELPQDIYSFSFDSFLFALDSVSVSGVQCRKIRTDEVRFFNAGIVPATPVSFYYAEGNRKILFLNKDPKKNCKSIARVGYLPDVSVDNPNCVLSQNILAPLMDRVLQTYLIAKNGVVIKEANDGNSNATMQNQSDPKLTKAQQ